VLRVYLSGEVNREALLAAPISLIKRLATLPANSPAGRLGSPEAAQAASRRAPHSSQKVASTGFSCWHPGGQVMLVFDLGRDRRSDGCATVALWGAGGQAAVQGHANGVNAKAALRTRRSGPGRLRAGRLCEKLAR